MPDRGGRRGPKRRGRRDVDQRVDEHVSENGINSQDTAFETWLSAQFQGRGSGRPDGYIAAIAAKVGVVQFNPPML